nr:hypothetical protein [Tanacetum cinerariifolium]
MASFDYRLNPLYPIKECSSCRALYTTNYCCSDGSLRDKIICDLDKTPELSQRPPQNCLECGNPVDEPFVVKQDPDENSLQSPPQINHHCCYGCGDLLEDMFSHKYTCELCGRGAHYGYNCLPKVLVVPDPEPFNNQTVDELPQTLPTMYINTQSWDRPIVCYYDDDDEDYAIAVTPSLSTEEPDNSLSIGDEHLDTISKTESDEFIKTNVENLVPIQVNQFENFSDSNNESTLIGDDSFSIDNIEYVEASPPDSELVNSEVMEIVISKVGGTDDDTLLTIKDDILQISSGSTTTYYDISLLDYEAFYDDHVKEISSGCTTTDSDSSIYDSFIFDLSINPFPLTDRSDFYKFPDELAHIISLPEYDCFCFKNEPNSRDFTMDVVDDIFLTIEPRVHNALPIHPNCQLNLDFILSSESLFTYVVFIFLPFLSYYVAPQYLLSFRNKDTIFDPGISSYHISSFIPDVSHQSGTFIKFKVLNGSLMEISFSTCSPMDQ